MSNRGLERGLIVRKVILASSIALTITLYLIAIILTGIFASNENRDRTYAEKLLNEVSPLKLFQFCTSRLQFIHQFVKMRCHT